MNNFCPVEVYVLVFEDEFLEKVACAHASLATEWGPQGQIDVKNADSYCTFYEPDIVLNMCFETSFSYVDLNSCFAIVN